MIYISVARGKTEKSEHINWSMVSLIWDGIFHILE